MGKFSTTKTAENKLAAQLKKVGKIVGGIINQHTEDGAIADAGALEIALQTYSDALGPWAESVTMKIINSVAASNKRAWNAASTKLGRELKRTLNDTPVGAVAIQLQNEQVNLIKSLPIEAGQKAQAISQQALIGGIRADESAKKISDLGDITANRGVLIARTETAKANASMTQARAASVGSTHYIWRTMEDSSVRPSHAVMDGTVQRFDNPPFIEGEGHHGPGMFPNCRCFAEPIITESKNQK